MDKVSSERRSEIMANIRAKGMKPEMVVRRLVHGMGYRFRLHRKDLPGKPDLVFPSRHRVIFVHSCFWHQHGDPECKITRLPQSNREYWVPKLERNKVRDAEHYQALNELGWEVLVAWECQLKDLDALAAQIENFLNSKNAIGNGN